MLHSLTHDFYNIQIGIFLCCMYFNMRYEHTHTFLQLLHCYCFEMLHLYGNRICAECLLIGSIESNIECTCQKMESEWKRIGQSYFGLLHFLWSLICIYMQMPFLQPSETLSFSQSSELNLETTNHWYRKSKVYTIACGII